MAGTQIAAAPPMGAGESIPGARPRRGGRRAEGAAVAVLLLAHVLLLVGQIGNHSPASDEPIHIAAGYRMWTTGASVDTTHPPLAMYLLAAPLLLLRPDPFADDFSFVQPAHRYPQRFLLENRVPMMTMLAAARLVAVLLTVALGLICWRWSRRLWGPAGALLSLALFAFSPAVLADGPIACNDVAGVLACVLALIAFRAYLGHPTGRTLLPFALAFAAAQATKYTSVLLIPICAALYGAKRLLERRGQSPRTAPTLSRAVRDAAAVALATALIVWALYGFETASITADPQLAANPAGAVVRKLLARLPAWVGTVRIPLYSFLKGLALQIFHAGNQAVWTGGYNHQFLFGANAPNGWWYYFPAALAVKTPLAVLVLLGWWAVQAIRRGRAPLPLGSGARGGEDRFDVWSIALPAVAWLLFCMGITINIGVRYVLLCTPLVFVLLGGLRLDSTRARAAAGALVLWQAIGCVASFPHVHAYFNEAAGGPRGGWRYLNNSSIDWGQDLAELRRYLDREAIRDPTLDYFGPLRPEDLGISYRPMPKDAEALRTLSGVVIVSETQLTARGPREELYRRLRAMTPVAQIGWTIFVYHL